MFLKYSLAILQKIKALQKEWKKMLKSSSISQSVVKNVFSLVSFSGAVADDDLLACRQIGRVVIRVEGSSTK